MATKEVRIRVGAEADASLETVFEPLRRSSKRARDQVINEMKGAAAAMAGAYRTNAKLVDGAFESAGKSAKKFSEVTGKATADAADKFRQLKSSADAIGPSLAMVAREATRELAKVERESARAALGLAKVKPAQSFASRMGYSGTGFGNPISMAAGLGRGALSFGARMIGSAIHGMGVETDLGAHFTKSMSLERQAVELSNSAFMKGKEGQAGIRQDPKQLEKEARKVGFETGYDATEAMSGLQKFVAKTGDLETGRKILKDMAVFARATGASLDDMVDMAGDVANNLQDIPKEQRAAAISNVVGMTVAAGKEGAVEVKDLASKMARVAAQGPQFAGDPQKNLGLLVAIAQQARASGGASSAAEAATSVASFTAQYGKGKRLKEMRAQGIEPYKDVGGVKQLRDPKDMIIEMLQKTAGDPEKLNKMIADQQAQRAVRGFRNIYASAYAGKKGTEEEKMAAGTEAVNKRFEELAEATMGQRELSISFQRAMNTSEVQVKQFNSRMEETANELRVQMLPALKQLAPVMIQAAGDISKAIVSITRGAPTVRSEQNLQLTNEAWNDASQMQARARNIKTTGEHTKQDEEAMLAANEEKRKLEGERAAMAKRQRDTATGAGAFNTGVDVIDKTVNPISMLTNAVATIDDAIAGARRKAGDKTATSFTEDAQAANNRQMQAIDTSLSKFSEAQAQMAAALKTTTLKVEVTNMPPQGVAPTNAATK